MEKAGLVLEGGGMKGVYTAGVLDFFMEKGLYFESTYGVSAGACMMTSYIAGQKGRGRDIFIDYIDDGRVMGLYSLLTTGDMFNADTNYNLIPNYINPFDYETFNKFEGNVYAVVTNVDTGEAEYKPIKDLKTDVEYIRASSSLPLVSKIVTIDGKHYMDGGLADSIPVREAERAGFDKIVVVMTKPVGYKKEPDKTLPLLKVRYPKYPKIYELIKFRHLVYNETLDHMDKLIKEGKVFLIQPGEQLDVDRVERDKDKLNRLYDEGYREAESRYEALKEFLRK